MLTVIIMLLGVAGVVALCWLYSVCTTKSW